MDEVELLDIADDLLIINKATLEKLFQEEDTNVLVLYVFYYKTAKWQKHNPIKANDEYCRKCLHWGLDKLKAVKRKLKEMKLIEVEKRFNDKHQLQGWYVRVNYYINKVDISSGVISTSRLFPLVDKQEINTINNNINTNNNKDTNTTTIIDYLENNGFSLTPIQYDVVKEWDDTELTRYAIKQAVLNNKYNIKYINKILYTYKKENIKTVEQAIAREEEFRNKKKKEPTWFNETNEVQELSDEDQEEFDRLVKMIEGECL